MRNILLVSIIPIVFLYCTNGPIQVAGSTNTTNAKVAGSIVHQNNKPADYVKVFLIPSNHVPNSSNQPLDSTILVDTTDNSGDYSFSNIKAGHYTIEAIHIVERTRLFISDISVDSLHTDSSRTDTLKPPSKLYITIPDTSGEGYVYIPGTVEKISKVESPIVEMDSVAAGHYPQIFFVSNFTSTAVEIYSDVKVLSSEPVIVSPFTLWQHSTKIMINTSSDGANITENMIDFPLLIRLNNDNFIFSASQPGGIDLRLSKADGMPLKYQIETWNTQSGNAVVWVQVDTIYGNRSDQFIYMYWGRETAGALSDGNAVFDTASGFQGVWHLSDAGESKRAIDATANQYHGTAINLTAESMTATGYIGGACDFNGDSQYIQIKNSAKSKINFPENSNYTISAWVYLDTVDTSYQVIVGKGWRQYQLQKLNISYWEFTEYKDQTGWAVTMSQAPVQTGAWTLVTGMRKGTKQYLYVNETCVDSSIELWPLDGNFDDSFDVTIGNLLGDVLKNRTYYFNGKIDEVRILDRACSADWVKLCHASQQPGNNVLSFIRQTTH